MRNWRSIMVPNGHPNREPHHPSPVRRFGPDGTYLGTIDPSTRVIVNPRGERLGKLKEAGLGVKWSKPKPIRVRRPTAVPEVSGVDAPW